MVQSTPLMLLAMWQYFDVVCGVSWLSIRAPLSHPASKVFFAFNDILPLSILALYILSIDHSWPNNLWHPQLKQASNTQHLLGSSHKIYLRQMTVNLTMYERTETDLYTYIRHLG